MRLLKAIGWVTGITMAAVSLVIIVTFIMSFIGIAILPIMMFCVLVWLAYDVLGDLE